MNNVCPKCAKKLSPNDVKCPDCGADLKGVTVEADELTDEQREAFEAGVPIEFASVTLSDEALQDMSEMDKMSLDDLIPNGLDSDSDDDDDDIIVKEGVKEIKKFTLPKPAKKLIRVLILVAAGFVLGLGLNIFIQRDTFNVVLNQIGYDAVNEILTQIPEDSLFSAYDIYVKRGADVTECIVFGVIYTEVNNYTPTYYRLLTVDGNNSDVTFFHPFDLDEYNFLKSGSDRERISADIMMNGYESFLRSVGEINAGDERWSKVSTEHVNMRLAQGEFPYTVRKVIGGGRTINN